MRVRSVLFLSACASTAAVWAAACSNGALATTTSGGATGGASSSVSVSSSSGSPSSTSVTTSGAGGAGGSGPLASPPDAGPPEPPTGKTAVTFAITKLYLGDTDPGGAPDPKNGWKHFGYNVDGVPPSYLAGFCSPAPGADLNSVREDGVGGVQNAWGHLVLPAILGVSPNLSQTINASIGAGTFSALFTLQALGPGSSDNPLPSQFVPAGDLGHAPKLDGTDSWPALAAFTVPLPTSYLVNDTWVTTTETAVPLYLPGVLGFGVPGSAIQLGSLHPSTVGVKLAHVVISMQLDAAHQRATNGILSGVITTSDLLATVRAEAPALGVSYCDPTSPALAELLAAVTNASDIMHDGLQDPLSPCDGITIGLGFEASIAQVGAPAQAPAPSFSCPDAGADAPSDATDDASDGSTDGSSDASSDASPDASEGGAGGGGTGGSDGG